MICEHLVIRFRVKLPLWHKCKVISEILVSEEKFLIPKSARCQDSLEYQIPNIKFFTFHLLWLVEPIHLIEASSLWDLRQKVFKVILRLIWERLSRLENKLIGKFWVLNFGSVLLENGKI